ncbi:hypothetical protein DFO67_10981 [Modicisalibacter xianhensis]|uniref:Uncharacterized protein n=1 Tax=Modicisalibacter xianhensis TaxID=442341 RepID=A0A4R8FYL8_9GAMM|nr:hypothetical protein [Halomonas xianhensis]TDX28698.1 hypothetical protein DFO67_10981 [Halomonas xianhensis]
MRNFFLLRRPLPRRTVVFCHLVAQVALFLNGVLWLVSQTPWLAETRWQAAWPSLALGGGLLLLAMIGLRLLADLFMLPHYIAGTLRQGIVPGAIMTRSFDRRPGVHDPQESWVNDTRPTGQAAIIDEEAVGNARVIKPRRPFSRRRADDGEQRSSRDDTDSEAAVASRQEPRL